MGLGGHVLTLDSPSPFYFFLFRLKLFQSSVVLCIIRSKVWRYCRWLKGLNSP